MIKKAAVIFLLVAATFSSIAQVLTVSSGTNMVITKGTIFYADNLVLTPSADFTLSDINLVRNTTVTHAAANPYIARVYHFSNTTMPYTGSVQINYNDGAELNGLAENALQLNVNDGTNWTAFAAATNDVINNYVLTTSLSNTYLNELTLAEVNFALPLQWRSFTAVKQQGNVALKWSTFTEQNIKSFTIQTGTNGSIWQTLATIPAAGNSNIISNYNYLHTSPAQGPDYYRIIETDADGRQSYSVIRTVFFTTPPFTIQVLGNPVTNGMLQLKIEMARPTDAAPVTALYSSDGKLLWKEQTGAGIHTINVSRFAKGTYLLKAKDTTIKFLIQ